MQGLTEFLPVSSTAHLRIVPAFVGWEDPGAAFTAVTQLGTMAAVLLYFRHDLWRIARGVAGGRCATARRAATSTRGSASTSSSARSRSAIFGLVFSDQIENGARNLTLIGCTLIALGLLLLAAEKVASHARGIETLHLPRRHHHRLRAGAARSCPACRARARRSPPACSSASSAPRPRATRSCCRSRPSCSPGCSSCATSARASTPPRCPPRSRRSRAFVVGYASIAFLLRYLGNHSTVVFVVYRVVLGVLVLALVGERARSARSLRGA